MKQGPQMLVDRDRDRHCIVGIAGNHRVGKALVEMDKRGQSWAGGKAGTVMFPAAAHMEDKRGPAASVVAAVAVDSKDSCLPAWLMFVCLFD